MKKILVYTIGVGLFMLLFASCSKKTNAPQYTTVTDYDGNTYKVFKIGTQYWMAGNLQTKHYADGTPLFNGDKNHVISDTILTYYLWQWGDTAYVYDFGYLYNWAAIMRGAASSNASPSGIQGPCPNGYHVPSNAEWQTLINYLGGSSVAGGPMKGFSYWEGGNVGYSYQNASGFNALPAGYLESVGIYANQHGEAYFWSTTQNDSINSNTIILTSGSASVSDTTMNNASGMSCRCLQNY